MTRGRLLQPGCASPCPDRPTTQSSTRQRRRPPGRRKRGSGRGSGRRRRRGGRALRRGRAGCLCLLLQGVRGAWFQVSGAGKHSARARVMHGASAACDARSPRPPRPPPRPPTTSACPCAHMGPGVTELLPLSGRDRAVLRMPAAHVGVAAIACAGGSIATTEAGGLGGRASLLALFTSFIFDFTSNFTGQQQVDAGQQQVDIHPKCLNTSKMCNRQPPPTTNKISESPQY
jgi:hypothetical protein